MDVRLPEGRGDARLEEAKDALLAEARPAADLDALFGRIAAETVDRPPSLLERLRERPTPVRLALGVLLGLAAALLAVGVAGVRPDLDAGALPRLAVLVLALAAAAVAATSIALRGLHRPPPGPGLRAIAAAALLFPLALAVVPGLLELHGPTVADAEHTLVCGLLGLGTAAFVTGALLALRRSRGGVLGGLATAGAAGLVAFAASAIWCAASDPLHLVAGHATAGLAIAAALALRRRRAA